MNFLNKYVIGGVGVLLGILLFSFWLSTHNEKVKIKYEAEKQEQVNKQVKQDEKKVIDTFNDSTINDDANAYADRLLKNSGSDRLQRTLEDSTSTEERHSEAGNSAVLQERQGTRPTVSTEGEQIKTAGCSLDDYDALSVVYDSWRLICETDEHGTEISWRLTVIE